MSRDFIEYKVETISVYAVDDFVEFSDDDVPLGSLSKEEDSDFVMEDEVSDKDSGSDWEESQRSSKRKGKVGSDSCF